MIRSCFIIEKGLEEKSVFPLYTRLTIGRSSRNDISLPDRTVSKRHAVVVRVRERCIVKDLDSHNGTYLNREKVEKAVLSSGDKLKIGKVTLRFFQAEAAPIGRSQHRETTRRDWKRLGEYLVEAGIVDEPSLLRALDDKKKDQRIGEMLIDMGLANDEDIAKAFSEQLNLPLVRLQDVTIPKEVISLIPAEVAEPNLLIPMELRGTKLVVAMADPLDSYALQILRLVTGMSIDTAVAPRGDIVEAFSKFYPKDYLRKILDGAPTLNEDLEDIEFT